MNHFKFFKIKKNHKELNQIVCPVCGKKFDKSREECPSCEATRNKLQDKKYVKNQKTIRLMTPEIKAAYNSDSQVLVNDCLKHPNDPEIFKKGTFEINKKYGLSF